MRPFGNGNGNGILVTLLLLTTHATEMWVVYAAKLFLTSFLNGPMNSEILMYGRLESSRPDGAANAQYIVPDLGS
jgi:hypothetical protein